MTDKNPLEQFVQKKGAKERPKRYMVSVTEEDYNYISDMATELSTTKVGIVTALINFYDLKTNPQQ